LIIIGLCILIGVSLLVFLFKKSLNNKDNEAEENKTSYVDIIDDYGYTLEKRDTELFKEKFNELKEVLSKKEVDYEEYAKLLSSLYIIDLYTISNKQNQYDVGSTEYVVESAKENFELKVKDTIYKYVEDNSNGKREQSLPEVASVEIGNVETGTFEFNEQKYDGYKVEVTWDYKEDLGYDKKATITLIQIDNKLCIIEQE
jgi:hypothetical protein